MLVLNPVDICCAADINAEICRVGSNTTGWHINADHAKNLNTHESAKLSIMGIWEWGIYGLIGGTVMVKQAHVFSQQDFVYVLPILSLHKNNIHCLNPNRYTQ